MTFRMRHARVDDAVSVAVLSRMIYTGRPVPSEDWRLAAEEPDGPRYLVAEHVASGAVMRLRQCST